MRRIDLARMPDQAQRMQGRLLQLLLASSLVFACTPRERSDQKAGSATEQGDVVIDKGCGHGDGHACEQAEVKPGQPGSAPGVALYGAALGQSPVVELGKLLSAPDKYKNQSVTVAGYVKRACTRKGCWMELSTSAEEKAKSCRVKFKDYSFFVPTDSQGKSARLEGVVQLTEVKKEAVAHYESEGATFANKLPDGSAYEVRLVATGVELSDG